MKRILSTSALLMLIMGGMPAATATAGTFQQTTSGCVNDPQDQDDPRGEVLRFCAALASGVASFAVDVEEQTNPDTDPAWTGSFSSNWRISIEATGDSEPDYTVDYRNRDGFGVSVIVTNDDTFATTCTGTATFGSGQYQADDLPVSSCFGGFNSLRALSTFTFNQDEPFVLTVDESAAVTPGSELPGPIGDQPTPPPPPPAAPPPPPPTDLAQAFRLQGASRFETAVEISQYQWPDGARDVYLSRSDEFADSISSGSLTAGPILLVPQCGTVPDAVLEEIERLQPQNVVALGGTVAICDQVLNAALSAANR